MAFAYQRWPVLVVRSCLSEHLHPTVAAEQVSDTIKGACTLLVQPQHLCSMKTFWRCYSQKQTSKPALQTWAGAFVKHSKDLGLRTYCSCLSQVSFRDESFRLALSRDLASEYEQKQPLIIGVRLM